MWRRILVNLLIFSYTSTQPISDHDGPRECCPCPKPTDMATQASFARSSLADDCPCRASVLFSNPEGGFTRNADADQAQAGSARDGMFMRAGGLDDCPCRLRDADSVGAPSFLLPTAVRALWPGVSDKAPKEDVKPLLHPEVGLASSVLETLREATDEEYQEALARDAVRSVLTTPDVEAMSDVSSAINTARDIVNVLLQPSDMDTESRGDSNSEASHVHESRCIHPLGRSNSLNLKLSPSAVNTKFRKEPVTLFNKNNVWDMDSSIGASNVNEQVIDSRGKNIDRIKSNTNPSLFSLFDGKSMDEPIKINTFGPSENNKNIFTEEDDKLRSPLDHINMQINNSLSDLKQKLDIHLQSMKNDNADKLKNVLDSISSPSVPNLVLKPIISTNKLDATTIKPFPLKSLLKLKDVELVPPFKTSSNDLNKARTNIPKLIPSFTKNDKESTLDLFKHFKASDLGDLISNGLKISFRNLNGKGGTDNIQPIPKGIFKSDILDAETSPSEVKTTINKGTKSSEDCADSINDDPLQNEASTQLPKIKNTEIIENVLQPADIKKQIINNLSPTTLECQKELDNKNINDLSNTGSPIQTNTEIIDSVPSPSQVQSIEITNENHDVEQEDFNDIPRDEIDCQSVNQENDSNVFSESEENNRNDDNISDFTNDQENIDETNSEDLDTEVKETEENCFQDSHDQQDTVPTARDDSPNEVESDSKQTSDLPSVINHQSSNEACDVENENESEVKFTPPLNKGTLTAFRKDNLRKLDKWKKPEWKVRFEENKSENIERHQVDKIPVISMQDTELENEPSQTLEIQDLQNMSDKLLNLSTKNDLVGATSHNINCINSDDSRKVFNKIPNTLEKLDANSIEEDITKPNIAIESEEADSNSDMSKFSDITDSNEKNFEKPISCTSDLGRKSNSDFKSNTKYEMTADASDTFVDKIAPESVNKPTLLTLHPKVQKTGSSLNGPNLKLPSLNEVKDGLVNILKPKNNFGFFNIKEERLSDDSNSMSAEASAPTYKSVFPSNQVLKDIDLDIFQLRPFSLPDSQKLLSKLPNLPQLNLNSYKAKLAIPKGFNIKPMKLESSLGGKNGLLGATLTVGSNKGSRLFNDPLGLSSIPTLEEFHSNLRENAQNLLLTPIDITGRNIIDDSLRSSQTLTDNIRSHAKNTMKDIQQTLESTFRDVKHSDLGLLADPLKDPKEFLQAVSRRHEDMTDKLKGIQYDLNDRLESIRDHITDQSLLPSLNAPMIRESSLIFGPDKIKEKPLMLSNSFGKPDRKIKATSKPKSQSNSRVSSSRKNTVKGKTIKLSAAPSVPVPKTVEAPQLRTVATSSPPPFILKHPSLRIPQLLTNKKSFADILREPISQFRDSKIPVLGKNKPVNKVKIMFGSTTIKPTLASRPSISGKPTSSVKLTRPLNHDAPRIKSKLRPSDSNGAPSVVTPTKIKAPVTNVEKEMVKERPITKSSSVLPKPKSVLNKSKPHNVDDKFTNGHAGIQFPSSNQSPLRSQSIANSGTTKNLDILSSLKEAVRVRLSNLTPLTNDKIVQPDTNNLDMLRSASENVESTNVGGLMKENASYTCKMICTRNN
ncbi:uncharacterized protein LOC128679443 [Plodia interpunctella]|uniref:uncharacterized protein LOC128679443 n=1 Tax=Plodia interpunctella TaxID=58824 RepID=UPI002368158F|nr:uncharacterized protein LOC128679443 [Plodia interpunctella]